MKVWKVTSFMGGLYSSVSQRAAVQISQVSGDKE